MLTTLHRFNQKYSVTLKTNITGSSNELQRSVNSESKGGYPTEGQFGVELPTEHSCPCPW